MKIFYDTEFLENGSTIELISIGLVTEDGREYYAVNSDASWERIREYEWLCEHVVPSLPLRGKVGSPLADSKAHFFIIDHRDPRVRPRWVIANEVREFILAVPDPQLWAWYAAYDHVALCQLWGPMAHLPKGIPMWTGDLKQEAMRLGNPEMPKQGEGKHNALADARHNRVMGEFLDSIASA